VVAALAGTLAACKPDESQLKAENQSLRNQVSKQESMILSLEDGTKVMQQQIDLLNRELRVVKDNAEHQETERKSLIAKLDAQLTENRKLTQETQRLQAKHLELAQTLRVAEKGGVSEELPQPLVTVAKAAEEALTRNGYAVRVSVRTEQRAVYVTERKSMPPASLEQSGFRNQYLISLQGLSSSGTRLSVRAEFEKLAQGNRVLPASPDETSEIERRLITEIGKALTGSGKV
jgi:predicted RNase H-like nuclease (RuvC/YqgF family)